MTAPLIEAQLLETIGQPDLSLTDARLGAVPGGYTVGELEPLFPKVERSAAV